MFLVPVSLIFVRPFVKRFALSYFGPFSVLSVCDVGLLWPNGWMDQDATWYGGRGLGPGHIVTWRVGVGDGVPLIHIRKGAQQPPHVSVYFALARSPISAAAELLFPFWFSALD